MEEYLIDREALEKFADELIKKKPLPVDEEGEIVAWREKTMKELDDRIGRAIFGSLSKEQLAEVSQMLDSEENSPEVFEEFFKKANVDIEKIIEDTVRKYGEEILGGENANS